MNRIDYVLNKLSDLYEFNKEIKKFKWVSSESNNAIGQANVAEEESKYNIVSDKQKNTRPNHQSS